MLSLLSYFRPLHVPSLLPHAIVPAGAFVLSTFVLPFLKKVWLGQRMQ
jgi:hypothetical protein